MESTTARRFERQIRVARGASDELSNVYYCRKETESPSIKCVCFWLAIHNCLFNRPHIPELIQRWQGYRV